MTDIKQQVATDIFDLIATHCANHELAGMHAEVQNISNLQFMVWVRPVPSQPRRAFIVQVKEQM